MLEQTKTNARVSAHRFRGAWLVALSLWLATIANAQTMTSVEFVGADSVSVAAPANVDDLRAVSILLQTQTKFEDTDLLRLQVSAESSVDLQVIAATTYLNGDRMLHAQAQVDGVLYSLVLTVGNGQLFGHLSSAGGSWQIYATSTGIDYRGWLYRPRQLQNAPTALNNDFIIPDRARVPRPSLPAVPRLPLQLGNTSSQVAVSNSATTGQINPGNFRVSQSFDRTSVLVGESVTSTLTFENISTQKHTGLYVEVYFVLENSSLKSAPNSCREQLSLTGQTVLYCELGDFAPGAVKSLSYSVTTSEQTRPQLVSTPVVGSLRLDGTVNVVSDVRSDSDGDGVSDFNEALAGTDALNPESVSFGDTVIDVMALYTPGARAAYPLGVETRINQLISVANQVYADSGVGIRLRPVFQGEVSYSDTVSMDTALDDIIYQTHSAFANVDELRARYGADLVMLVRPLGNETDRCGLAPVGGYHTNGDFSAATEKQFAFALIGVDCPTDIVVAHELGHNMGLTHSHIEDGSGGTFDFATGYGVDGQFATVMALPAAFNTDVRVAQFSNPRLDCMGFICGVEEGLPAAADAALTLNIAKFQIANYFPTTVPDLPSSVVTTRSGEPTSARIAMAASYNNGLSFDSHVTPDDLVDVLAEIAVDARHVGMNGNIYALISAQNGLVYQLTANGSVVQWAGTPEDLKALVTTDKLRKLERLSLLEGFQFDAALVGQEFHLYVAYEVSAIGEFVYTTTPLVVKVQSAH